MARIRIRGVRPSPGGEESAGRRPGAPSPEEAPVVVVTERAQGGAKLPASVRARMALRGQTPGGTPAVRPESNVARARVAGRGPGATTGGRDYEALREMRKATDLAQYQRALDYIATYQNALANFDRDWIPNSSLNEATNDRNRAERKALLEKALTDWQKYLARAQKRIGRYPEAASLTGTVKNMNGILGPSWGVGSGKASPGIV